MNSWVSGQCCHVIPLLLNTPSQSMKCFNINITTNCHPVQLMGSSVPLRLYLQILNHPFSQQQPSPPSLRPAALSCAVKIIHKARFASSHCNIFWKFRKACFMRWIPFMDNLILWYSEHPCWNISSIFKDIMHSFGLYTSLRIHMCRLYKKPRFITRRSPSLSYISNTKFWSSLVHMKLFLEPLLNSLFKHLLI